MARWLLKRGDQATDDSVEQLPPEIRAKIRADLQARQTANEADVWPENACAVDVFVGSQTQWRTTFGGLIGLDYPAVRLTYRSLGYPTADWKDTFWRIQVLEGEALRILNERGSR